MSDPHASLCLVTGLSEVVLPDQITAQWYSEGGEIARPVVLPAGAIILIDPSLEARAVAADACGILIDRWYIQTEAGDVLHLDAATWDALARMAAPS